MVYTYDILILLHDTLNTLMLRSSLDRNSNYAGIIIELSVTNAFKRFKSMHSYILKRQKRIEVGLKAEEAGLAWPNTWVLDCYNQRILPAIRKHTEINYSTVCTRV